MADSQVSAATTGREMIQPYDGPRKGPGIAAHGPTPNAGLRAAMGFAEMIVDTVRDGLLVLDLDLRVQAANESFYRMFEAERAATEGQLVFDLDGGVWDRPEFRVLLERVLPEQHVFDDFEVERGEGEARRVFHLNGRRLNHHEMVLLSVADVTERVLDREALDRAHREVEKTNRNLERRVDSRTRQVRVLASKLAVAEQEERRRLALVLHDDLQQHLFGATFTLELLAREDSSVARTELLDRTRRALNDGITMARSLAAELSPSVLDADGLGDVLRWLAERKRNLYGLDVEVEGDATVADRPVRLLLYNVVREALFNVAKHAGTERARVVLEESDGRIVVRVEDEGAGFDPATLAAGGDTDGFGLPSVRERIEAIGGSLDVTSAAGKGTRITLTVPLPQEPAGPQRD
ncbi:MAG TPA: sensor histidine kinase [Rubricoccaceae bacterium]|jgi:signal transduction histidine kinase